MKKGFTLIELLAVIVILAIIALIATPIILGIINDARKESNERSAELYASAVRNAVAAYQLTGTSAPTSFVDLDIQYDGEVECATEELYEDGSFYITDCTVNGDTVDYTYGEQQVTQPTTYYSLSSGKVGEVLPDDAEPNLSDVNTNGYPIYLKLEAEDEKVSTVYLCFKREGNDTEYCLKGYDTEAYETNKTVLEEAFGASACSFGVDYSNCRAGDLTVYAPSGGNVFANVADASCDVYPSGSFECSQR